MTIDGNISYHVDVRISCFPDVALPSFKEGVLWLVPQAFRGKRHDLVVLPIDYLYELDGLPVYDHVQR